MASIKLKTEDGASVEFHDGIIGQGAMKDVYMSPDRSYVVAFFREPIAFTGRDRLNQIVGAYRDKIFHQEGGDYWKNLFYWPTNIVEWQGRTGLVVPAYGNQFYFEHGSKSDDFLGIKGKEKEGKWFASASNRNKFLDPREKGNLLSYLRICILISRAVRRLHAAGLAHGDLSYKNILIDPVGGGACVISDIDGLVVPGKFPPDVIGTPDFIAPEVIASQHLNKEDPKRALPSIRTDQHALAVLIYMYLFFRHPLRGSKVHDQDPAKDEELSMGRNALFVEHPTDRSNRVRIDHVRPADLPWADADKLPFTLAGPLLSDLFLKAFIHGLRDPRARPSADEWEQALVKTVDMIQPCQNHACEMKWFVFDNTTAPECPYCGTPNKNKLPILNLYSSRRAGTFSPDNHRVMVFDGQSLFSWHVSRFVFPNERLKREQTKRVGYFQYHNGEWFLVNEGLPHLQDVADQNAVPVGKHICLRNNQQLLLSREDGGRLVHVQMINGS